MFLKEEVPAPSTSPKPAGGPVAPEEDNGRPEDPRIWPPDKRLKTTSRATNSKEGVFRHAFLLPCDSLHLPGSCVLVV